MTPLSPLPAEAFCKAAVLLGLLRQLYGIVDIGEEFVETYLLACRYFFRLVVDDGIDSHGAIEGVVRVVKLVGVDTSECDEGVDIVRGSVEECAQVGRRTFGIIEQKFGLGAVTKGIAVSRVECQGFIEIGYRRSRQFVLQTVETH